MSKQKEKKSAFYFCLGKGHKDGTFLKNQMKQTSFQDMTLWQKMFPEKIKKYK